MKIGKAVVSTIKQGMYCNKLMNKPGTIIAVCSLSKHAYLSTTTGTYIAQAVVAGCSSIGVYLSTQAAYSSVPNRRPCTFIYFSTSFVCLIDSQKDNSVCFLWTIYQISLYTTVIGLYAYIFLENFPPVCLF